ncbi:hypothetical protein ES703_44488 [subsurface metagenome]
MSILRKLAKSQSFPQFLLPGCVHQVFLTANNVGNFHQIVIYHTGKVIRWESIALLYDKIAHLAGCKCDLAAHHIGNNNRALPRNSKAYRYRPTLSTHLFDIFFAWKLFRAGIYEVLLSGLSFPAKCIELFRHIKTIISLLLIEQFLYVFIIDVPPLRLQIRPVRPAHFRALVPLDAKPAQVLHNLLHSGRSVSFLVRILNAKYKCSAHTLSKKPVKKSGSGPADVKITSR